MIDRASLHDLVDRFHGRRILLYGDLVLDRYVLGTPKRISREAPVIILRFEEQWDIPGGGANALANLASLGGTAVPVGVVGDDEPGEALLAALRARGIDTSPVLLAPGYRTPTKVRVLAGGPTSLKHQVARYDKEDVLSDHDGWQARLAAALTGLAGSCDGAAISDYGYGAVDADGVAVLRRALPAGAAAIADSRFSLTALGAVDGATPNLEELTEVAGTPLEDDAGVAGAAEQLRRRLGARHVLATRGSRGLTLVEESGSPLHLPVYGTDQVADVTGAGDTVLVTFTLALAAGATPREAATLANLAGGVVVMKFGTATVTPAELHHAIDQAGFVDD